jgi:hypothetical protein
VILTGTFEFYQYHEKYGTGWQAHEQCVASLLFFRPIAASAQVDPNGMFFWRLLDTEATAFFTYAQAIDDALFRKDLAKLRHEIGQASYSIISSS